LHQHDVGLEASAGILNRVEHAPRQGTKRLVGPHDIQVEIRLDFEIFQGVVKHRAMLPGMNYGCVKLFGTPAQFLDYQR
jgi:hypothetical protein